MGENSLLDVSTSQFLRIKVDIEVWRPLIDGILYPRLKGLLAKVLFKYKRLSEFCYFCGSLGHVLQMCPLYFGKTSVAQYSQELRAMAKIPADLSKWKSKHPWTKHSLTICPHYPISTSENTHPRKSTYLLTSKISATKEREN